MYALKGVTNDLEIKIDQLEQKGQVAEMHRFYYKGILIKELAYRPAKYQINC